MRKPSEKAKQFAEKLSVLYTERETNGPPLQTIEVVALFDEALAEHQRVLETAKYALESANRLFKGKQYKDAGFNPDGETPIFVRNALTEIAKLRKE